VPERGAPDKPPPVITASEIGEYAYCSRAWWYRHVAKVSLPEGEGPNRLAEGTRSHRRHGSLVSQSARLQTLGLLLGLAGAVILAIALLLN